MAVPREAQTIFIAGEDFDAVLSLDNIDFGTYVSLFIDDPFFFVLAYPLSCSSISTQNYG